MTVLSRKIIIPRSVLLAFLVSVLLVKDLFVLHPQQKMIQGFKELNLPLQATGHLLFACDLSKAFVSPS
ncbi:unnamed protein product [Brassica oleracea]